MSRLSNSRALKSRGSGYIVPHDLSTVGCSCDTLEFHPHPRIKEPPLCHQQPYGRYPLKSMSRCVPYSAARGMALCWRSMSYCCVPLAETRSHPHRCQNRACRAPPGPHWWERRGASQQCEAIAGQRARACAGRGDRWRLVGDTC